MPAPITFYFEFSSPYGHFAAREIEALAARHGRTVDWKPYLMGVVMKQTGMVPLIQVPLKGDYMKRDLQRTAREMGFDFKLPDPFPFLAVAPSRAFYWLHDRDPALADELRVRAAGAGQLAAAAGLELDIGISCRFRSLLPCIKGPCVSIARAE